MMLLILLREWQLAWRRSGELWLVLTFFVIVASLFPFAVSAKPEILQAIGSGVIWVAALLAMLLSLPMMFHSDHEDGTFDQWLVQPIALEWVVFTKMLAQWLMACLPIILLSPVLATLYGLQAEAWRLLMLSLLTGTPVLVSIGTIGAALTTGLRKAGSVLAVIVMPLCIPVLIFGSAAALSEMKPEMVSNGILLLGGLALAGIPAASFISATALRNTVG